MGAATIELIVQAGGVGLGLAGLGALVYTIQRLFNHLQHLTEALSGITQQMEHVATVLDTVLITRRRD